MKGIIFDFDGTLVDSMYYWSQLSRKYLHLKGKETDEETENKLKSMPVYKSSAYIKEKYNIEDDVETIAADIYKLMEDYYKDIIELKPNVLSYLDSMKEKGIKMGVATATDLFMINFAIDRLGIRHYFEFVISSRQYNTSKAESSKEFIMLQNRAFFRWLSKIDTVIPEYQNRIKISR